MNIAMLSTELLRASQVEIRKEQDRIANDNSGEFVSEAHRLARWKALEQTWNENMLELLKRL